MLEDGVEDEAVPPVEVNHRAVLAGAVGAARTHPLPVLERPGVGGALAFPAEVV